MSEITGHVKEIFQGETTKGRNTGDPFWSITLEEKPDERITCFAEEEKKGWIEGLEQGVEYTFVVKVSGKYINIAGQTVPCENISDIGEEEASHAQPPAKINKPVKIAQRRKPPVSTSSAGTERVFKNRISALQASVTFGTTAMSTLEDVLENAQKFYSWIAE